MKKILITCISGISLLVLPAPSKAQINFTPFTSFPTGSNPLSIVCGDFNNDGKLDVATANYNGINVSVLLGNGAGGFGAPTNFPVGKLPYGICAADFNGDGNLDIAVTGGLNYVCVMYGNGAGGFATPVVVMLGGTQGQSILAADLNNDSHMDIVVVNSGSNNISILFGQAGGGFLPAVNYNTDGYPNSVTCADFNHDGYLDLVTANENNNDLTLLLGSASGVFTGTNIPVLSSGGVAVRTVFNADLNKDGFSDLIVCDDNSSMVSVMLNAGNGTFGAPTNFASGFGSICAAPVDLDGDGNLDLAVSDREGTKTVSVLRGDGRGGFCSAMTFPVTADARYIVAADVNGDHKPDLITCNGSSNNMCVLLNTSQSISASPLTTAICPGGQVTLTAASSSNSPTWYPTTGLNVSSGKVVVASPSATTTYTVTGADCSFSTATVTVYPSPAVSISSINQLCVSGTVTLTAQGANTYTWVNGPSTPTNTVTLSASNTYTVTGTDGNGCTNTATQTITVFPLPVVSAIASPNVVWTGSPTTLTAAGASIYSWSGGVSNGVVFTPASTTTYTVTGSSNGCSNTATILVTVAPSPCNLTFDYLVPATGATASSLFGGLTTLTNKNILVTGPLTIDNSMTLTGCNVVLSPLVKITLTTGNLTLNNQTHLMACSNLWGGIYVGSGTTLATTGSVFIEDGTMAVNIANGGKALIDQTIFNRNLFAIELTANTGATSPLSLTGSVITSRTIPFYPIAASNFSVASVMANVTASATPYPIAAIRAPYSNIRACYGIDATDVNTLTVGLASAGKSNCIDAVTDGVNLTRTNAAIYNNQFQYLLGYTTVECALGQPCYNESGYGVKAMGVSSGTGTNSVTIGGTGSYQANSFLNSYQAMNLTNYQNNTVLNNSIDNVLTGTFSLFSIGYGDFGVYVAPAANSTVMINNQSLIRNCQTGIWVNCNSADASEVKVMQVDDNALITANSAGHCTTGIYVTGLMASGGAPTLSGSTIWEINGNTITEAASCISLSYLAPSTVEGSVNNNSCTVKYAATGALNGIRAVGCNFINISNNHTKYDVSSAYASTGNILAYGISLQNSVLMGIHCNEVDGAARSLVFDGQCTSTFGFGTSPQGVSQNTMHNAQDGLVLLTSGTTVGLQGSVTPSNNYWDMSSVFSNSQTFSNTPTEVSGAGTTLGVSPITTGMATMPTINKGSYPFTTVPPAWSGWGSLFPNGDAPPPVCGAVPPVIDPGNSGARRLTESSAGLYLRMITPPETALPEYNDETFWQHRYFVFKELRRNATLLTDAGLQRFYADNLQGTLGLLSQVDEEILNHHFESARSTNTGISSTNTLEANQKTVNSLLLKTLITPETELSKTELASLTEIATQCPLSGGNAVYQARNLLMRIKHEALAFADNCSSEKKPVQEIEPTVLSGVFKLYPNPNNGIMTLGYSINPSDEAMVCFYDLTGKRIASYLLKTETDRLQIDQTGLSAGIYFYTVELNGKVVKHDKLVVVK